MKVTGLAVVPPPTAADLPRVTPELLASVLARYSRSNEGMAAILEQGGRRATRRVDRPHPEVRRLRTRIDRRPDGRTGGRLDGVSMWLAYKLFEIATDGGRTGVEHALHRHGSANSRQAGSSGIPSDLTASWGEILGRSFSAYQAEYARLDALRHRRSWADPPPEGRQARGRRPDPEELRPGPRPLFHSVGHENQVWRSSRRRGCGRRQ